MRLEIKFVICAFVIAALSIGYFSTVSHTANAMTAADAVVATAAAEIGSATTPVVASASEVATSDAVVASEAAPAK